MEASVVITYDPTLEEKKVLINVHNYLLGEKAHGILTRRDYPPS